VQPLPLSPGNLAAKIPRLWAVSAAKIGRIDERFDQSLGSPVYTVEGHYTARGWTEWTEGFLYGSSLLQFDATRDEQFLELGRSRTVERMVRHVTHTGVHDHGFNNVSTFGNLLRLAREGVIEAGDWETRYYELALMASGAVQGARWSTTSTGCGYIYSFNGPHSLFADTIRSLRSLAIAHLLGHRLMGENDRRISLLDRLVQHAATTARYIVYYGTGRDAYDLRGRVAHEAVFNPNDGSYRCPSTQQGYSPFTTWTRGLAWIMCGFAEQIEFVDSLDPQIVQEELPGMTVLLDLLGLVGEEPEKTEVAGGLTLKEQVLAFMRRACRAACDFYIANTPLDGIPYWDTGAPGLAMMGDYRARPADPFNEYEPVDSSAAAIATQGLMRFGRHLLPTDRDAGERYLRAGLTILNTLLEEPYLSLDPRHEGLLLHSIYHRPNGWDHLSAGRRVPSGESSMWGDYHLREAALYLDRLISGKPYLNFFPQEVPNDNC
jgi:hypothetical protein